MRVCAKEIEKVRDDARREEERKRKERGVEEGSGRMDDATTPTAHVCLDTGSFSSPTSEIKQERTSILCPDRHKAGDRDVDEHGNGGSDLVAVAVTCRERCPSR